MGLKDLKIPEAIIEIPGGNFAVRGLSLDDLAWLVRRHGEAMRKVFSEFTASDADLTSDSVAGFLLPLVDSMPGLVSEIIACAGGEAGEADLVRKLPFPVQIDALEKVIDLSFDAAGGPKKLVETVVRMAQGTTGLLESLKT